MSDQTDNFLFGGAKSATFPTIGTTLSGTITAPPEMSQQRDMKTGDLKVWPDGNPMMQMVLTLDTDEHDPADPDDDGQRRLFIKSGLKSAVARAVKAAGATRLEVGGTLTVRYSSDGKQEKRGFSAPKIYEATYQRPADNLLGAAEPAAATAAAPAATAAAPATTAAALGNLSPEAAAALANLLGGNQ